LAQQHFDRLSALDTSFLHQEGPSSHMHVGATTVFAGPAPAYEELLDALRERLHLVPRYRQKLAFPPLQTGRPLWVDDPGFHLQDHVPHVALPAPGGDDDLAALTARIFSRRLDRARPLWELWLVEGLAGGRFALVSKTHHSLIDGVSGVDLATVVFDLQREHVVVDHPAEPWVAQPEPGSAALAASGVVSAVRGSLRIGRAAVRAATRPTSAVARTREATEGLGEIARAALDPAPSTPLNVPIGPDRRFVFVRNDLREFKAVKDAFGGTVNDVVLTVVTGGLRGWLIDHDVDVDGLELRALVPVSIRTEDQRHHLGNRIAAMRGPLPVWVEDPVERLQVVRAEMDGLKESKQAVGAEVLAGVQDFAPPTILAQASRLNFSTRLFNLLVTNVPGPQFPLYLRGRELQDVFPVAFLPEDHALAVAIMSYHGRMNFGLLGDREALSDLQRLGTGIRAELEALLARAGARV
jgi:diacylglycerol O-acyltransferase / wax synthase